MPWQFILRFDIEYLVQIQGSGKPIISYDDNIIEETEANWSMARQAGSFDMHHYFALRKARKVVCER